MVQNYSVKYMETPSGYMGQVVEWPEVISEGKGGWIVNMTVFDEDNQPISLNSLMREKGYVYSLAKTPQ